MKSKVIHPCPDCGTPCDAASNFDGEPAQPVAGDVMVCAYCGCVQAVLADGGTRKATASDLDGLNGQQLVQLYAARAAAIKLARERN
jgi:hypothetical protein